jgi:antitoxin (DNA-binding transcriptional repressor) of toxin-antitoxin stability system
VVAGERIVLTHLGKPVAELRPFAAPRRLGELPDILAALPRLTESEAAAFADDLDRARNELNNIG